MATRTRRITNPVRQLDDWPDDWRPAAIVAELTGRSIYTVRTWAARGQVQTMVWEATGERLVSLIDAREADRATPRRCGGRNARAALADTLHRLGPQAAGATPIT